MKKNKIGLLSGALLLMMALGGTQAKADRVAFAFNGGPYSLSFHSGWHRYWGGPTIGFYYAPAPCYVVDGYPDPYYYIDPDFWYANPAFGLSIGIGFGGGHYHGGFDRLHDGAFRAAAARESLGISGSSAFRGSESRAVSGGLRESGNGGSHVSDAASRAASARESVGFGAPGSRGSSTREAEGLGRAGSSAYSGRSESYSGRSESYGGRSESYGGERGGGFRGGGIESHGSGGGAGHGGGGHR